jgi:hypothetical protein
MATETGPIAMAAIKSAALDFLTAFLPVFFATP